MNLRIPVYWVVGTAFNDAPRMRKGSLFCGLHILSWYSVVCRTDVWWTYYDI